MRGRVGWGGGGRVCGLACLSSAPPVAPSSACPLLLSFRWLVWLCSFFFWGGGGWLGCCALVWVCAGVGAGVGVGVVGDGGRVAVVFVSPWVRRVAGVGLVSMSTLSLAAVCRLSSSAAPHGGLLWWCLGGGLGLCGSWEGAGHAGSGWLGGGGRACVGLRVCLLLPPWLLPLPVPYSSLFVGLFGFVLFFSFFWGGGWLGCCALVLVCAGVGAGVGVGVVGDGGRVAVVLWVPCVCAGPQASGSQGAGPGGLTAGGRWQWWRGACVGGCGSWLVSGWRSRAWACVWVCSWRGLMGWRAVRAWLVCVGVGYVCAEGAVGRAGAPWAMQWVEEMLVTPTGGCCRRQTAFCC